MEIYTHMDEAKYAQRSLAPWEEDLLRRNPEYCGWGLGCDAMPAMPSSGRVCLSDSLEYETWRAFDSDKWSLDKYNEVVNFYFAFQEDGRRSFMLLTLWVLHPRKGAARGIQVNHLQEGDVPAVLDFLRQARDRNAERFGKLD